MTLLQGVMVSHLKITIGSKYITFLNIKMKNPQSAYEKIKKELKRKKKTSDWMDV